MAQARRRDPERREVRKKALLRAAREVFVARGYHDAKVEDIAAAANVAKGTVYLYFPDKRSLFIQLVDDLFERLSLAIQVLDVARNVEDQIRRNLRAIVGVLLDDPALTQILFSYASGLDAAFVAKVRSFYAGVTQVLEQALRDGQAMGIVEAGDAGAFATFTVGGMKEILLEAAVLGKVGPNDREALEESLFRVLDRGYLRIPRR